MDTCNESGEGNNQNPANLAPLLSMPRIDSLLRAGSFNPAILKSVPEGPRRHVRAPVARGEARCYTAPRDGDPHFGRAGRGHHMGPLLAKPGCLKEVDFAGDFPGKP